MTFGRLEKSGLPKQNRPLSGNIDPTTGGIQRQEDRQAFPGFEKLLNQRGIEDFSGHNPDKMDFDKINGFYIEYQSIWDELSQSWINYRKQESS